ncbi:MAG: hypothetical protein E7349_03230 [Clostridiales bacterium]|nr:hypothetical protein [Clostridiales bacterium]
MSVDKVILKAVLNTLAAIAALFVFLFSALIIFYPSTMMKFTYDMGMDAASISYAKREYKRTSEIYYIARATETAIGLGDAEKILSCGEIFIADEDFASYCAEINANKPENTKGGYEQYIYGQVCVSEYALGKKTEAVERAFGYIGDAFPVQNAVAAVLISALVKGDIQTVELIKGKMEQLQVANLSEADKAYYAEILALINLEMDELSA